MATELNPWLPFLVFSINGDRNATHATATNTGREAQAYLQFIVTYYSCLPKVCNPLPSSYCLVHTRPDLQACACAMKRGEGKGGGGSRRPRAAAPRWRLPFAALVLRSKWLSLSSVCTSHTRLGEEFVRCIARDRGLHRPPTI